MTVPRRIYYAAAAVVATMAFGTIGFVVVDDYPWFDALYMTVTTVFSIGYGEIHPLSHAGRVFNVCLIFFGGIMFLGAIGAFTQALIELELYQFFGKRRVKHKGGENQKTTNISRFGRGGRGGGGGGGN